MDLLTWYFERRLDSWGYGSCQPAYRLSHCQGDGVAWYGQLGDTDIIRMLPRLGMTPSQRGAIHRGLDKGISVEVSKIGPAMYDHFNTMECRIDLGGCADELTQFEEQTAELLAQAIDEDLVDRSRQLEREGHDIVEAMPAVPETIRSYGRGDLDVEIRKHPPDEGLLDMVDGADCFLAIRRMMRGAVEVYDLEVEIVEHGASDSYWIGCVEDVPDGVCWRGFARELLRDARQPAATAA